MDARALPARNALDLVGAFDVIEHIVEDEAVLREVHAVLVNGGGFIAAVPQHPFLWSDLDDISGHVRRYTRPILVESVALAARDIFQTRE